MQAQQFRETRRRLRQKGLFALSDLAGLATILVELALSGVLIYGITAAPGWWGLALTVPFGIVLFRWFVILHECGHHTLFRTKWANAAAGLLASMFCLIPYYPWHNIHLRHHRWAGVIDKDPTQRNLLTLKDSMPVRNTLFRIVWYLWIPFPFLRFIVESFWLYGFQQLRAAHWRNARLGLLSDLICALPQWILFFWMGPVSWAIHVVPVYFVYLIVIENMSLPQHTALTPYLSVTHPDPIPHPEQDMVTRSTYLPNWLSVVLSLNFNRHAEHHMFPNVPWYGLNRLRAELIGAGYSYPHEVPFLMFMRQLRLRDPLSLYRGSLPTPDSPDL